MGLSSLSLDAFLAVAKSGGFSFAAKQINLTQSALSQRIKNLEEELGLTLFIRTPTGTKLTEQGERLLRYCQSRDSMEGELLSDLNFAQNKSGALSGTIKIAAYSSVLRSVLFPSLKPLLEKNPAVLVELKSTHMSHLPGMLQRGEVDFIVMDYSLERSNLQKNVLGAEKYVMITNLKATAPENVFLDNNAEDRATEMFFQAQPADLRPKKYQRAYLDDCYGIIDGVIMGLGRAVMPEHLVSENPQIKILKGYRSVKVEAVLHYYQQPFYSKLQQAVIDTLTKNASRFF